MTPRNKAKGCSGEKVYNAMREIFGPARLIDLREWLVFEVSAGGGMRWGDGTLLAGRRERGGGAGKQGSEGPDQGSRQKNSSLSDFAL